MTAFRKKSAREMALEERYPDSGQSGSSRIDRTPGDRPLVVRHGLDEFEGVGNQPANDDAGTGAQYSPVSPQFFGSRYFWAAAMVATFFLLFSLFTGLISLGAIVTMLHTPDQLPGFLLAVAMIAGLPWLLAMSAHRNSVQHEM